MMDYKRVLAVRDIHGMYGKLIKLMGKVQFDPSDDLLVFLGDYIDRGSQSLECLDYVMNLQLQYPKRVIALMGNHEAMCVGYIQFYLLGCEPYMPQFDLTLVCSWLENGSIPIIALIRNADKSTLSFKKELMEIKNQNMDITHFEENLNAAKERFMNNLRLAGNQFNSAIANIDKTIKNLEEIKENLRLTIRHMQAANNNLDDITIRKLVKGNPTMTAKFDAQEQDQPDQ